MPQYCVTVRDQNHKETHRVWIWADTSREANRKAIKQARVLLDEWDIEVVSTLLPGEKLKQ